MRINEQSSPQNVQNKALTVKLLNTMTLLERNFGYLLPNGWRAIVELEPKPGATHWVREMPTCPYETAAFYLDMTSDHGGGVFAETKMNTMKRLGINHTGGDLKIELVNSYLLTLLPYDMREKEKQKLVTIEKCERVSDIPAELVTWMRETAGFTTYLGGISVPFEGFFVDDHNTLVTRGDARVAFSGASQEQDVMFACYLLQAMMSATQEIDPNTSLQYDPRRLLEVPAIRLWFDLLID